MRASDFVSTVVLHKRAMTDRICLLELADPDDWKLPPFAPGAHIDVHLKSGLVRQYSLCADPTIANRYRIAVLRDDKGKGGSKEVVDELQQGDELCVSLPRNLFPLCLDARNTILIAGGIGITPMMSMIPVLHRMQRPFQLHVCTRDAASTPFLDELQPLIASGHAVLHHDGGNPSNGLKFADVIARQPDDTHYYCCGPAGFLDAYICATSGLPERLVHYERFSASADMFQSEFAVRLEKSGRTIQVMKGESVAEALQRSDVKLMVGCRAGICGLCRVPHLSGDVIHRDFKLTDEERRTLMTSCVSGCSSGELVLDL